MRKANERTTERDSLESVRTPWPARRDRLSHLLPAYSRPREGGKEMPRCCLQTLESPARSSFPMDGCEQRGDASRIRQCSFLAQVSTVNSSLNYLFNIHAIWTVSIFCTVKILWLMRIVLHRNESYHRKNNKASELRSNNMVIIFLASLLCIINMQWHFVLN